MTKPILVVQHIAHEGPGLLAGVLEEHSISSITVDLSKGERYPDPRNFSAVITLGGPQSANDPNPVMSSELDAIKIVLQENIPYLGICLGMQTLVKAAGGTVKACETKEIGFLDPGGVPFSVELTPDGREDPLFRDLGSTFRVFQLHGETVALDESMALLATGKICRHQIVKASERAYGIQSHFELTPELLGSWLEIDNDLQRMDRRKMLEEFEAIQGDYEKTGTLLLKNFLRVVGIV